MRKKAANDMTPALPRLILVKPDPERLAKDAENDIKPAATDAEALEDILSRGVSYMKALSRDTIGAERPCERIRFKVILLGPSTDFGRKLSKKMLVDFLNSELGKPLRTVRRDSEELIVALEAAEDAHKIRLKQVEPAGF